MNAIWSGTNDAVPDAWRCAPGCSGLSWSQALMQNYFNYFTEIEERFQQRRGSLLMLSTLDWALIET